VDHSPSARRGRRARWADRENEKRQRSYRLALDRWRADEAELRAMIATARSPQSVPLPPVLPPVELREGETARWAAPGQAMVEAQLPGPPGETGYRRFSLDQTRPPPALDPPPYPVRAHGAVIVTDRRVIFRGTNKNREWAYAKLMGYTHDPDRPCTLIHVSNRKKTSGVLLDPGNAAGFRFAFTLALAEHAGDRHGFVAHLERLLAEHTRGSTTQRREATPA
jgi:hypothetical protein